MNLMPVRAETEATVAEASRLAQALPGLSLQAQQIAVSVLHGLHGRRQAGMGDQFWQYRHYISGDATAQIDWRRSARSDHVLLREREWQAAQKVWLWIDNSKSMNFASSADLMSKRDCAYVLGLALADMLVRGGERVGLIGLSPLQASRNVIARFAEILAQAPQRKMPEAGPLAAKAQAIWISDFLLSLPEIEARLALLSGQGARGTLLLIADPQEELFPFAGHVEFRADDQARVQVFDRAELARDAYLNEMAAHRDGLKEIAARYGWTLTQHRTDRPMAQCLIGLAVQLGLQVDLR